MNFIRRCRIWELNSLNIYIRFNCVICWSNLSIRS
nr:MAG TPA: hypothetical protein [Caudoviricetes sp.]